MAYLGGGEIWHHGERGNSGKIINRYKKIISGYNKKGNFRFNFVERLRKRSRRFGKGLGKGLG